MEGFLSMIVTAADTLLDLKRPYVWHSKGMGSVQPFTQTDPESDRKAEIQNRHTNTKTASIYDSVGNAQGIERYSISKTNTHT